MGLELALINHKNKTFFWLGKGSWYILKDQLDLLQDKETLRECLREVFEEIFCHAAYGSYEAHPVLDEDDLKYLEELVEKLHPFIDGATKDELSIGNDSDDSIFEVRHKGYKCVGTRYREDNPNDYNH